MYRESLKTMDKEFPYKEWFCNWFNANVKRKTSDDKACNPYAEGICKLLKNQPNIPDFEREYSYYVPALLLRGERDLAKKLLACVYADVCVYENSKSLSYFKCYCKFIAKEFIKKEVDGTSVQLEDRKLKKIKTYLNIREVWIIDKNLANYLKIIDGVKPLKELFSIRIEKWKRSYFHLDTIIKVFKKTKPFYMRKWKKDIRECIKVIVAPPLESDDFIQYKDVKAFELRRKNGKEYFSVEIIDKKNKKHIVWTPLANGNRSEMRVNRMDDITIDHDYPLELIVKGIIQRGNSEIEKIAKIATTDIKTKIIIPNEINIEKLIKEMEEIKKATSYTLMLRSENAKKSNNIIS